MKKLLTIALALLLTAALIISASAAGELGMALKAGTTTLGRGESVTITVSVAGFADCKSGALQITYDSSMFTRSNNEWLISNTMMAAADDTAVFVLNGAQKLSGAVYRFTLTAKENATIKASDVTVLLKLKNSSGTETSEVKSIQITVACQHSYGAWTKKDGDVHVHTCGKCGGTETEKHKWDGGKVTTQNGCNQPGVMTYTCTVCGATKTETILAGDHVWDGGVVTKYPTCTASGTRLYTCASCGTTKTETIEATGDHDYGVWKRTDDAKHTRECKHCGTTQSRDHNWDDGVVTKEATCVQEGERAYTCIDCGASKWETVAKLTTHTYDNSCDSTCNYCSQTRTPPHAYGTKWSSDGKNHWHACTLCGARKDEAAHLPGPAATEWDDQICTTCGYVLQKALGHTHRFDSSYTTDAEGHWYACASCDEKKDYAEHFYLKPCDTTCAICGYEREVQHDYSERLSFDVNGHWNACKNCGDILQKMPHNPGPAATETTDQICIDCGFIIKQANNHVHAAHGDLLSDGENHWFQCACGEIIDKAGHTWNEGVKDTTLGTMTYLCTVCGYSRVELLTDVSQPTDPVEPTGPDASEPGAAGNTEQPGQNGQQGGTEDPGKTPGLAWWWYLVIALCILLLGAVIFVIIGILVSRKQVGKYSSQ